MTSAREPGAGAAVTGLFLGGLAIAGAVALVTAPITPRMAVAQTAANPNDRPATATLSGAAGTVTGREYARGALSPSIVPVMSDGSGSRIDRLRLR
ncbi:MULTISPECIES: hypothetical protein [Methylobacterium]|uniref:Serine protease n=1 Tax=Methylobacterium thuringiense TaxID=1003091 RepID=A0ABQ4TKE7_9HYPH|nr:MULTISPECIES: hypothetical protein [Methylobacterium]TXN22394.1 hypothetical protein FV217_10795 [Methylobacterium sp. WL9]GJE55783.1 hypothetical protein EKPJFOCH_2278 [Methylobacterium thuringiense]